MNKKGYSKFSQEINELYSKGDFQSTIELIESSIDNYPEHESEIKLDLAVLSLRVGNVEKTLEVLTSQIEKGVWYPKIYFEKYWDTEEFKVLAEAWEKLSREANLKSEKQLIVFTPEGYDKEKTYPLFIALHGWGEDAAMFKEFWKSEKLQGEYILAMPQSSQMIGSSNYCWNDLDIAHRELNEAYNELLQGYSVDRERVLVGGFSQGATMAMEAAIVRKEMPFKAFIALNPNKPEGFNSEMVLEAAENGIRGVILTGDKDGCYEEQREMMKIFEELNFKCRFIVKENFGHWFPEDLGDRIDASLEYIFEE